MSHNFYGKPYYSLDAWCKENYGHKLYKIALDIGCGCPNRDGKIASGGCYFCSAGGSGDFAKTSHNKEDIKKTILHAASSLEKKWEDISDNAKKNHLIAYFQSYTNTYGDPQTLKEYFQEALDFDMVAGISIATRPDCLDEDICQMLLELKEKYKEKFIWIELGLQTIHDDIAESFNRGYEYSTFLDARKKLERMGIPYIIHLILGLPNEDKYSLDETIKEINSINPFGLKLQLLHILENTKYAQFYRQGKIRVLDLEEYTDMVVYYLKNLNENICIHRITGDGDKNILIAPKWSMNKRKVLNTIHKKCLDK